MFVPQVVAGATGAPLLVFLHGAGRTVEPFVDAFGPVAEANGVIVLAPFARDQTWDRIFGTFGSDVARINSILEYVFERWPIDPERIVLSGFSDGATYALAVGRANGDLFSRLVAFAPGFLFNVNAVGRPPVVVTHGTRDQVLSYAKTAQQIVPSLVQLGYDVDFRSFPGDHVVPLTVVNEVFADLGAG
jgi:phospholipase/carboxylesterase